MVTISHTSESDDRRTTGQHTAESDAGLPGGRRTATGDDDAGESRSEPLLCWVCRRPLDRRASIRWRGEPVHCDCV